MRSAPIAIAAAMLAAIPAPVAAQTAVDRADARCVLVLQVAARDPKQKEAAGQGTFFFTGRLTGRGAAGAKLDAILLAAGKEITQPAQVQTELNRCGAELTKASSDLRAAFQRLQQATRPTPPAK